MGSIYQSFDRFNKHPNQHQTVSEQMKKKTIKIVGYLWDGSNWISVIFPKCSDGGLKHNVYHYHIGWYGPFEAVVGTCKDCKHHFKGTEMQFKKNVKERGDLELFKKSFPEGMGGIKL